MREENGTTPALQRASTSCNRSWCVVEATAPEEHYDHHAGDVVQLRNGEDEVWSAYLLEREGEPLSVVLEADEHARHSVARSRFEMPAWQVNELLALGEDGRSAAGFAALLREVE